jgi:hypothetical protein
MVAAVLNNIGCDTVDLVFRTNSGTVDDNNVPIFDERIVGKTNCCVTIAEGTSVSGAAGVVSATSGGADTIEGSLAIYTMKALLPVDDDTQIVGAAGDDALQYQGLLFELNRGGTVKYFSDGTPSHVRVFGSAEIPTGQNAEMVTIIPRNGRDDNGQPAADGTPVPVLAANVEPGNTTISYGITGELDTADFTVALPIDAVINDNDAMIVRGRYGIVRVTKSINRWVDRQVQVVLVYSFTGGKI